MTLGQKLKSLRERKSLTTREISKLFNLGKSTISNYENDARKPDYEMLKKLANYYDVSIDYLLGKTNDPNIKVLEGDSLPKELLEMDIERIEILKEADFLTNEEIKELIQWAKKVRGIS